MQRPRARQLGLDHWLLPTGTYNAITDVAGVRVGHTTLVHGDGPLRPGQGPVRTGVTTILPHAGNLFQEKVIAAAYTINGFGKACGLEQVRELGVLETPIALTNTLNVWLMADALAQQAVQQNPAIGIHTSTVNPVVGECNDGFLNDIQGRHVQAEHLFAALANASAGPVEEGSVGAGTGTSCFGWKGGIGTSSRHLPDSVGGFTLGALVQSNFGSSHELTMGGRLVGRVLQPPRVTPSPPPTPGSIMIILATDAPLSARQLQRLCARVSVGLARTGSHIGHGSGDFVIAVSTAQRIPHTSTNLVAPLRMLMDEATVIEPL
ncbi:MAG: P1 family peptidase, partial [Chloroflexi bacterium]|nr:P1 family peptidase [Chloroflexota bacterium]